MSDARVEKFRRIVEAAPDNHLARFGLANAFLEGGLYDEAAAEYRRCLVARSDWMAVAIALGRCLVRLGRHDEARETLERARRLAVAQGHTGPQEEIREILSEIP